MTSRHFYGSRSVLGRFELLNSFSRGLAICMKEAHAILEAEESLAKQAGGSRQDKVLKQLLLAKREANLIRRILS